ncbi:MAG: transcription antitermination protein NusB [Muribaculaceae bacterium]|nr:transcription antitermination protein NusB [Muribaculaceae bacterium]
MKTVQLLYSYLLVEKPFGLESQPFAPTKEKRFAYNLYMDLVYLMMDLSKKVVGKNRKTPLEDTRFIIKVEKDDRIKSMGIKYADGSFPFTSVEPHLIEAIKNSLLFREFEKNRSEGLTTDNFWENTFNSLIITDSEVNKVIREFPGYSLSGEERMKQTMEETFRNFYSSKDNIEDSLKTLQLSMAKARDLYMRLLALPVELTRLRSDQLELNRRKYLATAADLNPNMKFVDNTVAREIENNYSFDKYIEDNHLSWRVEDPELLEILLKKILDSEIYRKYEESSDSGIHQDAEFWKDVFTEIILNDKDFLEYLENKSVFWNDDLEIMGSFVLKTLKRIENPETREDSVMPMYKDGDNGKDARFGSELFNYVIRNKDIYRKYIDDVLARDKWETERLAFMDVVITMTALAEIINYPEIPLNVSINEYIEIAKSYSSAKSGQFVHGLLSSLIESLRGEGIIHK